MSPKLIRRLINTVMARKVDGFDPAFYRTLYGDMRFKSDRQVLDHYVRHGRSEWRSPNRQAYLQQVAEMEAEVGEEFELAAYKFYNQDLLAALVYDEEFIRHFIVHGRAEGRRCQFDEDSERPEILLPEDRWKTAFSPSELIAWCGNELEQIPQTRAEALDLFWEQGIDRLWPISFAYAFDVDFIRENDIIPEHSKVSDADLYRTWLAHGFPAGLAPNAQMFLAPYLGGLPFPEALDWRAFAKLMRLPAKATRSQVLIALFDQPSAMIIRHVGLMGGDAAWLLGRIGKRALVRADFKKGAALLQQSCAIAPVAEYLSLLGDAHLGAGDEDEALAAYAASIEQGRAPIGAYLSSAEIQCADKQFSKAFDTLRAASVHWRQKVEFGQAVRKAAQAYFEHQSARAHALLAPRDEEGAQAGEVSAKADSLRRRTEADALLTDTLDKILGLFTELESLPAPIGGNSEGYVAILANDALRQCTHYRIEQKVRQFEQADIPVRVFSHSDVEGFLESLVGARAAIFYRVAAVPEIVRAIHHANSMGLDTYYEIDDLIFDARCYPDPFASFEGQISAREYAGLQFGVPLFRYAMAMCKGSIASTPALSERMQQVTQTRSSIVIRNGLDERNDAVILMGKHPISHNGRRVRIFYGSGTKAHNADFNERVGPALLDLMNRYPQVDLVIVGHLKLMPTLAAMDGRVRTFPIIKDVTSYWSILASCDINLAVLEPGEVADCKSEIKWLEAAVLQVPSIVSATRTYLEVLTDGVNGLLVDTPAEWHEALERLIADEQLRQMIGSTAREKALRDYSLESAAGILADHFGAAQVHAVPQAPRSRLRVLVCNVFYAPQSYGGATRVVEDNVAAFRGEHPDVEIAIFCAVDGASPPGQLHMGSEDGVPVYRLSTPGEMDMDWRPFNEDNAEPFERVLDHFQPDIIHFHCIQRLTATIVEVALRRNIPYIVTTHDAWWLSDHQFLVDEDGFLRLPGTDPLRDCEGSRHGAASLARRQRLASLLMASEAVLSVSEPFAAIYANAGIGNIIVTENATPDIMAIDHTTRTDGRLALGHIGGRSAHKGAVLIEAILRRNRFDNLHLTMVDGTLGPGQSIDTVWGTTPVTLTAPFPQSGVGQLYGQLDVLLAPSTWPESFGLVTREALQCGLWVVTSNLGAIGRDVIEDQNGFIVDVATPSGLHAILRKLDEQPARFSERHQCATYLSRTNAMQAREIHAVYKRIADNMAQSEHSG